MSRLQTAGMNAWQDPPANAYRYAQAVGPDVIDVNGHVNNVAYIQWMQDAAVRHYGSIEAVKALALDAFTWVARSHQIEYLSPAFEGDVLEVATWVADFARVRSNRHYAFTRRGDGRRIAHGVTDWIFFDRVRQRPAVIPPDLKAAFELP
jgi:acyl-CoA thioester hydrolase